MSVRGRSALKKASHFYCCRLNSSNWDECNCSSCGSDLRLPPDRANFSASAWGRCLIASRFSERRSENRVPLSRRSLPDRACPRLGSYPSGNRSQRLLHRSTRLSAQSDSLLCGCDGVHRPFCAAAKGARTLLRGSGQRCECFRKIHIRRHAYPSRQMQLSRRLTF
jgi:hypothetical protein